MEDKQQENEVRDMTCDEKIASAKHARDTSNTNRINAEQRGGEVANEFTRLEVQIAALLIPFSALFIDKLAKADVSQWYKFFFALSISSLILSLILGLLHLKREERFFDDSMNQKHHRFLEWNRAVQHEISYDEAWGYQRGTMLGKGQIITVPIWTWILQTIFLGIGVGLQFVIFIAYLFGNGIL